MRDRLWLPAWTHGSWNHHTICIDAKDNAGGRIHILRKSTRLIAMFSSAIFIAFPCQMVTIYQSFPIICTNFEFYSFFSTSVPTRTKCAVFPNSLHSVSLAYDSDGQICFPQPFHQVCLLFYHSLLHKRRRATLSPLRRSVRKSTASNFRLLWSASLILSCFSYHVTLICQISETLPWAFCFPSDYSLSE